jgi:hypothetical protein
MVGKYRPNRQLIKKVAEIYDWLDSQIESHRNLAGSCKACGKCCDFENFDHKLFVTSPELIYLSANLHGENLKPMKTSRCPYNVDGRCTIYECRFAGCRIFCCNGDADFQNGLSESAIKKFKSLCDEYQVEYRYSELATALNSFER